MFGLNRIWKSRRELAATNVKLLAENERLQAMLEDARKEIAFHKDRRRRIGEFIDVVASSMRRHLDKTSADVFVPARAVADSADGCDEDRKPYEGKVTTFTRGFGL